MGPLRDTMQAAEQHDSDWEYEYSATESESYYLTIDISVPDLLNRTGDGIVHNTRSGYRSWLHPIVRDDRDDRDDHADHATKRVLFDDEVEIIEPGGLEGEDDGDDDNALLDGRQDPQMAAADGANADDVGRLGKEDEEAGEIQILDLHSSNPIISYKGQVFTGAWSENIGTELLFAHHDPDDPLPAVRHLPDGIDLVGASSARITCTQGELRSRLHVEQADRLKKARRKNGFVIPVQDDAKDVRRPQAIFLESLMAIKRMKGEQDAVTVKAIDRTKQLKATGGIPVRRRRSRGKRVKANITRALRRHREDMP